MKQLFLSIFMVCSCLIGQAQTQITTNSSCDTNTDGNVNIEDVTNTTNKVLGKTAAEKNVVTAEQLNTVLGEINAKLDELKELKTQLALLEEKNNKITDNLGITENARELVDLGLSVKWATMNIGASKPEESGLYFAWGETTGYGSDLSDGRLFDWTSYTLCKGTFNTQQKYCFSTSHGVVDNKTVLDNEDDAASANWGGAWRMPTKTEQDDLRTKCYWEWTSNYNDSEVSGWIVYKVKSDSDKGKVKTNGGSVTTVCSYTMMDSHIFLPAAGCRYGTKLQDVGSLGYYWSSSLSTSLSYRANYLYLLSSSVTWSSENRCIGQCVRAVCP